MLASEQLAGVRALGGRRVPDVVDVPGVLRQHADDELAHARLLGHVEGLDELAIGMNGRHRLTPSLSARPPLGMSAQAESRRQSRR